MNKNKLLYCTIVIVLLLACFNFLCHSFIGCHSRVGGNPLNPRESGNPLIVHDTLKIPTISYKLLPGTNYNIDSLITVINQFWKDSLKNMYGKGLFQAKYSKEDALGTRSYTLASRIPLDPESQLTVDEFFIFPKKTFGLIAGLSSMLEGSVGLKYYIHDSKHFSITGIASGDYLLDKKTWTPNARLELELNY